MKCQLCQHAVLRYERCALITSSWTWPEAELLKACEAAQGLQALEGHAPLVEQVQALKLAALCDGIHHIRRHLLKTDQEPV